MGKNLRVAVFIFFGILMIVTGFRKIINLEFIPFESLSFNMGRYCGISARTFVGVILVFKGVENIK